MSETATVKRLKEKFARQRGFKVMYSLENESEILQLALLVEELPTLANNPIKKRLTEDLIIEFIGRIRDYKGKDWTLEKELEA
jgi:hypothetical protein